MITFIPLQSLCIFVNTFILIVLTFLNLVFLAFPFFIFKQSQVRHVEQCCLHFDFKSAPNLVFLQTRCSCIFVLSVTAGSHLQMAECAHVRLLSAVGHHSLFVGVEDNCEGWRHMTSWWLHAWLTAASLSYWFVFAYLFVSKKSSES